MHERLTQITRNRPLSCQNPLVRARANIIANRIYKYINRNSSQSVKFIESDYFPFNGNFFSTCSTVDNSSRDTPSDETRSVVVLFKTSR